MKELKYKLSNGDLVSIVNQSDVPKEYEVYAENGQLLGTVFTDREDGTDDAELKPFAAELRQAIYDFCRNLWHGRCPPSLGGGFVAISLFFCLYDDYGLLLHC